MVVFCKRAGARRHVRCAATCSAVALTLVPLACEKLAGEVVRPIVDERGNENLRMSLPLSPDAIVTGSPSPTPASSAPQAHSTERPRTIRFAWRPSGASAEAYAMDEPEDQHRIVLAPNISAGGSHPVL